jgi:CubicO group peptidase (beta-lactamase class C family)
VRAFLAAMALGAIALTTTAGTAAARPARCATPTGSFEKRAPASLAIDGAKLREALDWAVEHTSTTTAVYRYGCLAGQSRLDDLGTSSVQFDGWSMTKSVTALLVGRAVTLGRYDPSKRLRKLYPEADRAHGKVLPTHLLTMTTGTHRNWVRDLSPQEDRVKDALSLPFDHRPGKHWEYQQSNVSWLLNSVQRSVKSKDIQVWAQKNLFGPLGIRRSSWSWDRDRTNHTEGWAHLKMVNQDWARLGQLMLQKGRWRGRQLIRRDWIKKMTTPSQKVNRAYGYLTWLNSGGHYVLPNVEGPDEGTGKLIATGPKDMWMFCGSGEQRVWAIPSLGLLIVRLGDRGSREGDTRASVWTGRGGELDNELIRRVLISVTDAHYRDPGPYPGSDVFLPPLDDGVVGDAADWEWAASGLGIGPNSPSN